MKFTDIDDTNKNNDKESLLNKVVQKNKICNKIAIFLFIMYRIDSTEIIEQKKCIKNKMRQIKVM